MAVIMSSRDRDLRFWAILAGCGISWSVVWFLLYHPFAFLAGLALVIFSAFEIGYLLEGQNPRVEQDEARDAARVV